MHIESTNTKLSTTNQATLNHAQEEEKRYIYAPVTKKKNFFLFFNKKFKKCLYKVDQRNSRLDFHPKN